MTNGEKLALLNTIELIDSSACAGELECVYVNQNTENRTKLMILGVTEDEMNSNMDSEGDIDIVPFISNYVQYGWFEESLGGFLESQPFLETLIGERDQYRLDAKNERELSESIVAEREQLIIENEALKNQLTEAETIIKKMVINFAIAAGHLPTE